MFAIYDVQGRRFRSTLEHLQKVRATQANQRASLRSDGGEQALQNLAEQTVGRTADDHPVSYNARQAYLDILHIKEREAVVHAYQLMSHPVVTIPLALDIPVAWRRFCEQPYHQLPVLDRQRRIVGILSERDFLRFLVIDGEQISYVPGKTIADAMAAEVITADPVTDVRRIAHVMLSYHLSAIPLVDEQDALIGLVSRSDILRAVTSDPPLSLWT
jgi:CBS domain-containing protein